MIDLKLSPQAAGDMRMPMLASPSEDAPLYPEGTKIELEGDTLRKFGIGSNLPAIGTRMTIVAIAEVVEACKEPNQIKDNYCLELQLTQMEMTPEAKTDNERIRGLYAPV